MGMVFEVQAVTEVVRGNSGVESTSQFLAYSGGAEVALNSTLRAFGSDAMTFEVRLENALRANGGRLPWAIIQFARDFRLAGHLSSVRGSRAALTFSSWSLSPSHDVFTDGIPPVSMILSFDRNALEFAAERSPLLARAWDLLSSKPPAGRYLCFPDPPDQDWVLLQERADDELFIASLPAGAPRPPIWPGWLTTPPRP
jgi:hypothetical protein